MPRAGQIWALSFYCKACQCLSENMNTQIHIKWVPGYMGISRGNEWADKLVNEAVALPSREPMSRTHALCHARCTMQKQWTKEWKEKTPSGQFTSANCISPLDSGKYHKRYLKD
jgi:hypothetical protein